MVYTLVDAPSFFLSAFDLDQIQHIRSSYFKLLNVQAGAYHSFTGSLHTAVALPLISTFTLTVLRTTAEQFLISKCSLTPHCPQGPLFLPFTKYVLFAVNHILLSR